MSFSEYNGSKAKVSQAVGRIFRNAQENLPKIQSSQVSALLKSIVANGRGGNGSERLNKAHPPPSQPPPTRKLSRFQKVLRPGLEKQRHAELLENQDADDNDSAEEEMESHLSLIGPPTTTSPHKQKRWPF